MENNILTIRCIHCGAVLQVRNQAGIEKLSVACPNCHEKFNVGEGIKSYQAKAVADSEATEYGPQKKAQDHEHTIIEKGTMLGELLETGTGKRHKLKVGTNTIGRAAQSGAANIQVPDPTKKMSREHAIIEVTPMSDGSYRHFLRNWKNKNKTYVGNEVLEPDESIVLQDGQLVKFGAVTMRFILPDDEKTEF